jgi:hypothetical protein
LPGPAAGRERARSRFRRRAARQGRGTLVAIPAQTRFSPLRDQSKIDRLWNESVDSLYFPKGLHALVIPACAGMTSKE